MLSCLIEISTCQIIVITRPNSFVAMSAARRKQNKGQRKKKKRRQINKLGLRTEQNASELNARRELCKLHKTYEVIGYEQNVNIGVTRMKNFLLWYIRVEMGHKNVVTCNRKYQCCSRKYLNIYKTFYE